MPDGGGQAHISGSLALLHGSRIGVLVLDPAGVVEHANALAQAHSGLAAADLLGRPLAGTPLWPGPNPAGEALAHALAIGCAWQGELAQPHPDGPALRQAMDVLPMPAAPGGVGGFLVLLHAAPPSSAPVACAVPSTFDHLTGLPREGDFRLALHDRIEQARQAQRPLSIARIDVDQFKVLGDSLGADEADRLLAGVAQRVGGAIRHEDLLARLAGEEFALLLHDAPAEPAALQRILAAVSQPMSVLGHPLAVTVSVGTAAYPVDGETADELLAAADTAVAEARRQGCGQIRHAVASPGGERGFGRRQVLADLRHVVERGELVLHYQPQLNLFSGHIVGVEALLRWAHPVQGLVPPLQFIPLAEESGLIVPISEWVLEHACAQAAAWRAAGLPALRMAVNLSARHFRFLDLIDTVRGALQRSGLNPAALELELTEGTVMHDVAAAIRTVDALKALGVRLSLDDFGTGHSSLAYLSRFAIDTIKIDQSFVRDVTTNAVNASIVSATIAMAHKLDKTVIAEGVETVGQARFLRSRDCEEMQGFLFSPALPAAEFEARLARGDHLDLQAHEARAESDNHLLIVDDEPNILAALRRLLRREGYQIFTAGSGAEGLEVLAREAVQVIICDHRMPGMSGTEFLSSVKSMYPHTVRIALSGYADVTALTHAVNRGAVYRFLSKPWDDEQLKSELRSAFRHSRQNLATG